MPGVEVSLEGMLTEGSLATLAIFDKPDPLDGPFFDETIYITPSRLPDGSLYIGFIFSRAATPAEAEASLRRAHARLDFTIR